MSKLNEMSVMELKSLAYDLLAQRDQTTLQLQAVNQAIAEAIKKPVEVKDK